MFENIKVGDKVLRVVELRYGFTYIKSYRVRAEVTRTTPKRFYLYFNGLEYAFDKATGRGVSNFYKVYPYCEEEDKTALWLEAVAHVDMHYDISIRLTTCIEKLKIDKRTTATTSWSSVDSALTLLEKEIEKVITSLEGGLKC